jgi:ABC-type multidrug transport system ATPase subunit
MQLILKDIGQRFNQKWIFKGLNMRFDSGLHYAITGKNGSGKSTLLMIIAGYINPSKGMVVRLFEEKSIEAEEVYKQVSISSPYLELIEDYSLEEILIFHGKFKPFLPGFNLESLISLSGLKESRHKALKHFSSGMKQRVKLLLAIMSNTQLVLLDEPCANLDSDAVSWYQQLKQDYGKNRSFIICSNHNPEEYQQVKEIFSI